MYNILNGFLLCLKLIEIVEKKNNNNTQKIEFLKASITVVKKQVLYLWRRETGS